MQTITEPIFQIGEQRHTSAGNVFELVGANDRHAFVKRVKAGERFGEELWDAGVLYFWSRSQWHSIPLVGEQSTDPTFGMFIP